MIRPAPATACASGRDQPLRSCSAEPARRFRPRRRISPAAGRLLLVTAESAASTRASGFSPALGLGVRPLVTLRCPRQRLMTAHGQTTQARCFSPESALDIVALTPKGKVFVLLSYYILWATTWTIPRPHHPSSLIGRRIRGRASQVSRSETRRLKVPRENAPPRAGAQAGEDIDGFVHMLHGPDIEAAFARSGHLRRPAFMAFLAARPSR